MAIKCRLCKRTPNEVGGVLNRVNEKGVTGIWECRPICGAEMSRDDAIVAAIEGTFDEQQDDDYIYPNTKGFYL